MHRERWRVAGALRDTRHERQYIQIEKEITDISIEREHLEGACSGCRHEREIDRCEKKYVKIYRENTYVYNEREHLVGTSGGIRYERDIDECIKRSLQFLAEQIGIDSLYILSCVCQYAHTRGITYERDVAHTWQDVQNRYRVARTHRMPDRYRSFSAKEPQN